MKSIWPNNFLSNYEIDKFMHFIGYFISSMCIKEKDFLNFFDTL